MIHDLAELFQEGGFWMYPIAALQLVSMIAIVVALIVALTTKGHDGKLGIGLGVLGVLPLVLGITGRAWGLRMMEEALVHVSADDAETIRAMGHAEALAPVLFGLFVALPLLAFGTLMSARFFAIRLGSRAVLGPILIGLGVTIVGAGVLNALSTTRSIAKALTMVDPSQRAMLRAAAEAESGQMIWIGGIGLAPMIAGAALLAIRRTR
jgi:hypothetical protein